MSRARTSFQTRPNVIVIQSVKEKKKKTRGPLGEGLSHIV